MRCIERLEPKLEGARFGERPEPEAPGHGEVLVRMRAASFNFIDLAVATGRYPGALFPNVPVADGAGEVIATGDGVETLAVGDRVAVHPKSRWIAGAGTAWNAAAMRGVTLPGALVEIARVDAATVVKAPEHLSWEQVAALPTAATTAWNALKAADIGPGSTVVVLGTGVVSLQALQLAKARGARVIVTSSSGDRIERARALGADHGIDYRAKPEWQNEVAALTDGVGADLVLETVGPDTFHRSIAAVRQAGVVFAIGFVSGSRMALDIMPVITKAVRIVGNNTGSVADLAEAARAIAAHRIEPAIGRVFPVSDIGEAYAALSRGGHFGKLAIRIDW